MLWTSQEHYDYVASVIYSKPIQIDAHLGYDVCKIFTNVKNLNQDDFKFIFMFNR